MKVLRKGFKQKLDPVITKFVSSTTDDEALIEVDIQGSLAHAKMLYACGLIDKKTKENLIHGLSQVKNYYQENGKKLDSQFEDVHMNVEEKLKEFVGTSADYLHTARSRNDQVALDLRLFVIKEAEELLTMVNQLQNNIVASAEKFSDLVMPGYTHMQRAQPILFSHSLLAFHAMLERDKQRLAETIERTKVSPLGSAALAGTSLPIDVQQTASELGFEKTFSNSLDAISDRDFIMDILYASTTIGVHLSQMAETIIIWMTKEFDFVNLPDSLTTASSIMPQKKNPDALELVRSKCGLTIGELVNVVTTLKGLPQGYNRDLQDTKPGVAKVCDTIKQALLVMSLTFKNLDVNSEKLEKAVSDSSLYATDILELLIKKGVPMRQAHNIVSKLAKDPTDLKEQPLETFQNISSEIDESIYNCFDPTYSVQHKVSKGSTGKTLVDKKLVSLKT